MRFRWAAVLLVVFVAIALGSVAYNAGVSHGLALGGQAAGAAPAATPAAPYPYPYPYGWYRPWGFGFGSPLLLLLFSFLLVRALLWRGPWRRRYHLDPRDVPWAFEDWHRRSHERMKTDPSTGASA